MVLDALDGAVIAWKQRLEAKIRVYLQCYGRKSWEDDIKNINKWEQLDLTLLLLLLRWVYSSYGSPPGFVTHVTRTS